MKRVLSIFLTLMVLTVIFSGCGSSKAKDSVAESGSAPMYKAGDQVDAMQSANSAESKRQTAAVNEAAPAAPSSAPAADSVTALTGTGEANRALSNPILNERKIIRNANVSVEVDDFDKAYGQLETMVAGIGYVQETRISKEKHYIAEKEVLKTKGTIILRIDAEKFGSVLKDVKGLGLLLDENIKSDDVTDKFFDLESRLRLIRYEESRLEEYLKKITDPDTIFKTEARLTDIRHEIESLTGNLHKLSNLVQLSTITINMSEKMPAAGKTGSYWQKLAANFTESVRGVVRFCGEFILAAAGALPGIALIFIIGLIGFVLYRKSLQKYMKFNTQKNKDIES